MKLAIFYHLPVGGALRVVKNQIKYLKQRHSVKAYCPSLLLTGNRLKRDWQNFVSLSRLHQKLAQTIDRERFDLCLVHPDWLTQAPFLLKFLNTPSIYYCHELLRIAYEPELGIPEDLTGYKRVYEALTRKLRQHLDRQNAQAASLILVNSKFTQKKVMKAYHQPASVCYPGVDTQVFKPVKIKPDQLLFIGQKAAINGWDLAAKLPVKVKVIDKQHLTDKELALEYSKSYCTLCLSHHEPFGLVSLESQACQTPVIAINEGGYKETVINNQTGFLIPRHPQILADKITYLISHPQTARQMGQLGRQHVSQHFTWKSHLDILETSLTKLTR